MSRPHAAVRSERRTAASVVASGVAVLALLTSCSSGAAAPAPATTPPSAPSSDTSTPAASSSAPAPPQTTKPARTPELPVKKAGTVTNTGKSSVSGSGPAEVRVTRKGSFGLVAQLDCSRCSGKVLLTAPGRGTPIEAVSAPFTGAYVVSSLKNDPRKQSLLLTTKGHWRLTFRSWNVIPVQRGKQSGHGSTVLYLLDRTSRIRVTYKPSGKSDRFSMNVYSEPKDGELFGNDTAFVETVKVDLPGVVAIRTTGSWTVTPK